MYALVVVASKRSNIAIATTFCSCGCRSMSSSWNQAHPPLPCRCCIAECCQGRVQMTCYHLYSFWGLRKPDLDWWQSSYLSTLCIPLHLLPSICSPPFHLLLQLLYPSHLLWPDSSTDPCRPNHPCVMSLQLVCKRIFWERIVHIYMVMRTITQWFHNFWTTVALRPASSLPPQVP